MKHNVQKKPLGLTHFGGALHLIATAARQITHAF
jgi:hypothetical protein